MKRKSQVSLFMIIVVILLIIFGIASFIVAGINPLSKPDISEVNNYIENSLRLTAKYCLNKIGLQGGYYEHKNYLEKQYSDVEYAYNGENVFLSQDELKTEIENCIKDVMPLCINDFKRLRTMGYQIQYNNFSPQIVLGLKDVSVMAEFDVEVKIGEKSYKIEKFKTDNIIVRLNSLHNITDKIVESRSGQQKSSDFDLSYLGSIDVNSSIYREKDGKQVYSLLDMESSMDNNNYYFLFSNDFKNEEKT